MLNFRDNEIRKAIEILGILHKKPEVVYTFFPARASGISYLTQRHKGHKGAEKNSP